MDLTRDDIRAVPCRNCGAEAGVQCRYAGKGASKRMRLGRVISDIMARGKWKY